MNPIKFLYNDLKSDIVFIKDVIKGKYGSDYFIRIIKAIIAHICTIGFWKRNWPFFLLLILTFLMGYLRGAWYYQDVCNQHIINTFYNETEKIIVDYGINLSIIN